MRHAVGVKRVHVDIGRGLGKCPRLSTRGGEGVKKGQNLVHVVIEWPLFFLDLYPDSFP